MNEEQARHALTAFKAHLPDADLPADSRLTRALRQAVIAAGLEPVVPQANDSEMLDFILRRVTHLKVSFRKEPNILKSLRMTWNSDHLGGDDFVKQFRRLLQEALDYAKR